MCVSRLLFVFSLGIIAVNLIFIHVKLRTFRTLSKLPGEGASFCLQVLTETLLYLFQKYVALFQFV